MNSGEDGIVKYLGVLRDYVIAIPFVHLLLTSLFLIGYYREAGRGLYNFLAISDLFSVSIGEIGPAYLSIIVFPSIFIVWSRLSRGAWTDYDAAIAAPDGERDRALARFRRSKKFYQWLIGVSALFVLGTLAYHSYNVGYLTYTFWFVVIFLIFFVINGRLHSRSDLPSYWMFVTYFAGAIFLFCYFAGLSKAQDDFHVTYSIATKSRSRCSDVVILRRLGERFIAIKSNNSRVLTDASCKTVMYLPAS